MDSNENTRDESYAKLVLNRNGLQVLGEGTIDCSITIKMIEALLKLPSNGPVSIKSIVDRMSSRTKRSFDNIVKLDSKLNAAFSKLPIGHDIKPDDVAEEFILGISPIAVVIFATDGKRYVSRETRKYDNLETIEEFENRTGMSVADWIRKDRAKLNEKWDQLLSLLATEPTVYHVDVVSKDQITGSMTMETLKITVCSEEQVRLYALRHELEVMNITTATKVS
jgi:hypothetical protein